MFKARKVIDKFVIVLQGDEEHGTSDDSVYSSENQDRSTSEYDSDSSLATTSSKCELEE